MLAAVEGKCRPLPAPRGAWSDADGAGQDWCACRGWEDGELVGENKAILFLTDVVLSIRQMRPQKLPRAEAGARKRKMAAAVPPPPGRERRWRAGGGRERERENGGK